jgi:UDP-N-acetyl-D-mannosaminuronate dehydrogenase
MANSASEKIAVIGLGYVGLPLALARTYPVTGFDISRSRVADLWGARDCIPRKIAEDDFSNLGDTSILADRAVVDD